MTRHYDAACGREEIADAHSPALGDVREQVSARSPGGVVEVRMVLVRRDHNSVGHGRRAGRHQHRRGKAPRSVLRARGVVDFGGNGAHVGAAVPRPAQPAATLATAAAATAATTGDAAAPPAHEELLHEASTAVERAFRDWRDHHANMVMWQRDEVVVLRRGGSGVPHACHRRRHVVVHRTSSFQMVFKEDMMGREV